MVNLLALQKGITRLSDCFESATSAKRTLIVPDKDADGLDAGVIIHRTLTFLGLSPSLIDVHLLKKGASIHSEDERATMQSKDPKYVIVVDQGSRPGPPIVESPEVKSMIIDHHLSDEFPRNALVSKAFQVPRLKLRRPSDCISLPLSTCRDFCTLDIRNM